MGSQEPPGPFLLGLVVVVAITVSAALASSPAGGAARLHAAGADCGKARWDIKTLNDPQNGEVDFHSDKVSVADLVGNKFDRDKGTFSGKVR